MSENKKRSFWSLLLHGSKSSDPKKKDGKGKTESKLKKQSFWSMLIFGKKKVKPEVEKKIDEALSSDEKKDKTDEVVESDSPAKESLTEKEVDEQQSSKEDVNLTQDKEGNPPEQDAKTRSKELLEAEQVYKRGLSAVKDMIAPASMEVNFNEIKMGDNFVKSFFVYSYPRFINENWLSPVINMDTTMDISMFIYPHRSEKILKTLRNKVAQMHSTVSLLRQKGIVRDPALEASLEDAERLRDQLQRGEEKFFQFGLYFTLFEKDQAKIDKSVIQLETVLGSKLVLTKRADMQMERAFVSTQPVCTDKLEITRNMNTSPLSSSFPFSSSDLSSDKGIMYGINRHNDSLIIFDRFSLPNANSVVLSTSGAGKSYAVKLEILRLMMFDTDIIVIDPENEYKELCDTAGGSFISLSLNSREKINPFDLPKGLRDSPDRPGDLLRSAIINTAGLLTVMLGEVSPEESSLLDKALIDTYAIKGITFETEKPGDMEVPIMEDLYKVLNTMDGASSLAKRLEKYVHGSYSGIFNSQTNIDLGTGMVVFNIRDLEEGLRPIAMHMLLNYVWNQVRSELKRRVLVVDEAWKIMQYEASAKFLFGLVKRARKYYLGVTTITQDVEDFIHSGYGKPIITNSSLQLLLKQAPSALEMLQKTFNLTEGEKYLLLNSAVGQGIFFAGTKHAAIQVVASYSEDRVITTNPEEILKKQSDDAKYE